MSPTTEWGDIEIVYCQLLIWMSAQLPENHWFNIHQTLQEISETGSVVHMVRMFCF